MNDKEVISYGSPFEDDDENENDTPVPSPHTLTPPVCPPLLTLWRTDGSGEGTAFGREPLLFILLFSAVGGSFMRYAEYQAGNLYENFNSR